MIVMIVAQQHHINVRQVFQANAGRPRAPGASPLKRTCSLTPNRIGKDIHSVYLDEKGGMIDKSDVNALIVSG